MIVIASEATQSRAKKKVWIASSNAGRRLIRRSQLAMTATKKGAPQHQSRRALLLRTVT
jgi:hypothetical protein